MSKKMKLVGLLLLTQLLTINCSRSRGPAAPDDFGGTISGTFVDAPVVGLGYVTDGVTSTTDNSGQFGCSLGDEIEFRLGNLVLGSADCSPVVFPMTLTGEGAIAAEGAAVAMAVLLQNLNDESQADRIVIPPAVREKDDFSAINFSAWDISMSGDVVAALTSAGVDTTGFDYSARASAAQAELESSLTNPAFVRLPQNIGQYVDKSFLLEASLNEDLSDEACVRKQFQDQDRKYAIRILSQTLNSKPVYKAQGVAWFGDSAPDFDSEELAASITETFITSDRLVLTSTCCAEAIPDVPMEPDSVQLLEINPRSFSSRTGIVARFTNIGNQISINGRMTESTTIEGNTQRCVFDLSGMEATVGSNGAI